MSVERAKAMYIGKEGYKKHNCAEAVACAFKDRFAFPDALLEQFRTCGGGRAPGGVCGALYAMKVLFERTDAAKVSACERDLVSRAGSKRCQEIRALRKLSCVGCVESVASHMEKMGI